MPAVKGKKLDRSPFIQRFLARVDRSGGPDACWPWIGPVNQRGYGQQNVPGLRGVAKSHRLALWLAKGSPPPNKPWALHACDNPPCCNPAHLDWGTRLENIWQAKERGRLVHPRGPADRRFQNIEGVQIGRFVAVERIEHGRELRFKRSAWRFACQDCGGLVEATANHAKTDRIKHQCRRAA